MNKFIVSMFALSSMVSLVAMEEQKAIVITEAENQGFLKHLNIVTTFSQQYIKEQKITENNGIYVILNQLSQDLTKQENKVENIIQLYGLHSRLQEYVKFESDSSVKELRETIVNNTKDTLNSCINSYTELQALLKKEEELKKNLKDARVKLVRQDLGQKWPQYSMPQEGQQVQNDASGFLVRNASYPADNQEAFKDYAAQFIFQLIIAPRINVLVPAGK